MDGTGEGPLGEAEPFGGAPREVELGSTSAHNHLVVIAGAEHGDVVGDQGGATLDQAGGGGGLAGARTTGNGKGSIVAEEGVRMQDKIPAVSGEGSQDFVGQSEVHPCLIYVRRRLEVDRVNAFNKKMADQGASITIIIARMMLSVK